MRVQGCWSVRNLAYKSNDDFKRKLMMVHTRGQGCGTHGSEGVHTHGSEGVHS